MEAFGAFVSLWESFVAFFGGALFLRRKLALV